MKRRLSTLSTFAALLVTVVPCLAQLMAKVPPAELSTRRFELAGISVEGFQLKTADFPQEAQLPYQRLNAKCTVKNMTLEQVKHMTVYLVGYDERGGPLFSVNFNVAVGAYSDYGALEPGKTQELGSPETLIEHGDLGRVAYYGVRLLVAKPPGAAPAEGGITQTNQPCTNPRCVKGMITYKGIGGKIVERRCPVCGGTGWVRPEQ